VNSGDLFCIFYNVQYLKIYLLDKYILFNKEAINWYKYL